MSVVRCVSEQAGEIDCVGGHHGGHMAAVIADEEDFSGSAPAGVDSKKVARPA